MVPLCRRWGYYWGFRANDGNAYSSWKNKDTAVNICVIEGLQYLLANTMIGLHYGKMNSIITLTARAVLLLSFVCSPGKIEALRERLQATTMRTAEKWGKRCITPCPVRT